MRRIWVEKETIKLPEFEIEGESFRHAILVSKMRAGEEFEIVNGSPTALVVKVKNIKKHSATLEVVGERNLAKITPPYIHLALCMPKWSTFESILEKSVELGVSSIQPLINEFSFIRSKKDFPASKVVRCNKIIKSSTEQSGRGLLLDLLEPVSLTEFITTFNQKKEAVGLFSYEGVSRIDVRSQLQALVKQKPMDYWMIVGSEGGFSYKEQLFMNESGYPPASLGEQILRVETACIVLTSIIKYELRKLTKST